MRDDWKSETTWKIWIKASRQLGPKSPTYLNGLCLPWQVTNSCRNSSHFLNQLLTPSLFNWAFHCIPKQKTKPKKMSSQCRAKFKSTSSCAMPSTSNATTTQTCTQFSLWWWWWWWYLMWFYRRDISWLAPFLGQCQFFFVCLSFGRRLWRERERNQRERDRRWEKERKKKKRKEREKWERSLLPGSLARLFY